MAMCHSPACTFKCSSYRAKTTPRAHKRELLREHRHSIRRYKASTPVVPSDCCRHNDFFEHATSRNCAEEALPKCSCNGELEARLVAPRPTKTGTPCSLSSKERAAPVMCWRVIVEGCVEPVIAIQCRMEFP